MARFTIQIPDELNKWLMRQATLNQRSKNKQIEHILTMASKMPFFNITEQPDHRLVTEEIERKGLKIE
jgi:hypothetical protein